jgi:HlyD family secretion protein
MSAILEAESIRHVYGSGSTSFAALRGVSLEIHRGEVMLLLGPSGSGKTTLLQVLGGLLRPTAGVLRLEGRTISGLDLDALARLRLAHFGFVFQAYNLFPTLTAAENVEVALDLVGLRASAAKQRARELLDDVGLGDRVQSYPSQLSGGQKQRVAIARALASDPAVVLADEPRRRGPGGRDRHPRQPHPRRGRSHREDGGRPDGSVRQIRGGTRIMKNRARTFLLAGLALAGAMGITVALEADAEAPQIEPTPLGLAAPGRVEPIGEEREVGARMPGLLVAVHVDENDRVVAGQVLAEIDRSELEAERLGALATIALERAQRDRLVNGARPQERQAAKARLAAAEAGLALAQKEHARTVPLSRRGVLTATDVDRATEQLDSARALQREASKQLSLLEASARRDELAISDAKIAVAEAELASIDAMIEKTYVRAPIAGTILVRHHRAGETVGATPPTPLFVIGDLSGRRVRAEIDEIDVARIHADDRVEVVADAWPGTRFGGRVLRVGQRVGGKSVSTERPTERQDRKVLDALVELDPGSDLPVGLRVDVFVVD